MVCSNCGTELAEGTRFCGQCGAPVIAKNKREYLQNLAPDKIQRRSKLCKLLAVACVLLMLLSYLVVINTSMENVPIIETVGQGELDTFTDMKEELEDMADALEEGMDEQEDELEDMLTKKQIRKLEKFAKALRKAASTLSISNFNTMVRRFEAVAKMEVDEQWDASDELEDIQEVKLVIGVVSGILIVGAVFIALFLFLGGYFHKSVLAILGAIGAFFYCLLGCGLWMVLLTLAVTGFMIYTIRTVNHSYKEHRKAK